MKRIDSCRKVFMSEKTGDIHKELDGFCAYHEDQFSYLGRLDAYNASVGGVTKDRTRYVQEKMESFDLKVALVAEDGAWLWYTLYVGLQREPSLPMLKCPYQHTDAEFEAIIAWMLEEEIAGKLSVVAPPVAGAMKLLARSEIGASIPSICPLKGLTPEIFNTRGKQCAYAAEEFLRTAWYNFPNMDFNSAEFTAFRGIATTLSCWSSLMDRYFEWRQAVFVRTCCDMIFAGLKKELRRLWVADAVEGSREDPTQFRHLLLLRENMSLRYSGVALESTGHVTGGALSFQKAAFLWSQEAFDSCRGAIAAFKDSKGAVQFSGVDYDLLPSNLSTVLGSSFIHGGATQVQEGRMQGLEESQPRLTTKVATSSSLDG